MMLVLNRNKVVPRVLSFLVLDGEGFFYQTERKTPGF
jgi:hypothetical protein